MAAARRRSGLRAAAAEREPAARSSSSSPSAITVLFAAAGLAFDVGRFYSERRFLQNAADAAALAAANALIRGETVRQADIRAREVLTRNFTHSPVRRRRRPCRRRRPSTRRPRRRPGVPDQRDPHHRRRGPGRRPEPGRLHVRADRRARPEHDRRPGPGRDACGNMLPIAVRHYVNRPARTPAPRARARRPDRVPWTSSRPPTRPASARRRTRRCGSSPTPGSNFDALNPEQQPVEPRPGHRDPRPGRAAATTAPTSAGFIALDIRNFQATGTAALLQRRHRRRRTPNTLKAMEANWVTIGGYPGPQFPPAITPPDPNDQVATMTGNSTGIVDRRDHQPVRARRRGPRRRLPGQRHGDPGLHDLAARRRSRCRRPARPRTPARSRSAPQPAFFGSQVTLDDARRHARPDEPADRSAR